MEYIGLFVDYICTSKYRRQNEDKTKTTREQELSQEQPILPAHTLGTDDKCCGCNLLNNF